MTVPGIPMLADAVISSVVVAAVASSRVPKNHLRLWGSGSEAERLLKGVL